MGVLEYTLRLQGVWDSIGLQQAPRVAERRHFSICVERLRWVAVFSTCFILGVFYVSFVSVFVVLDLDRDASVEDLSTLQCITAWLFTY